MLKIDKADVKKGANKIKVVIKDSSGGTSYPSFGKYPLRIYSDSKIVSEGLDSANFWVVD